MSEETLKPCLNYGEGEGVICLTSWRVCENCESNLVALNQRIKELENDYAQLLQQFGYQTEEVRKLEAWQKEALEMFSSLISPLEDQRCPHWHIKKIKELIEQAEDK